MAQEVVRSGRCSIKLACLAFRVSLTCYRYQPRLAPENAEIADKLIQLTYNQRNWGLGLCFLYLRNVKGYRWNHKRVYRIYRELELNLRIKPRKRIVRKKPEPLAVPAATNQCWSTEGAPGERIAPRPVNFCIHPADRLINTSIKVLRRPVESALRATVGVMHQAVIALWLPRIQCLLQRIENKVGLHRAADTPTDDAPGEHVDHEGDVLPSLPRGDVGEVRDPEFIGTFGAELPIDFVQRTRGLAVTAGRAHDLASPYPLQSDAAHQSFDGTTRHSRSLASQLTPDFHRAIDLHVGLPDTRDLRSKEIVAVGTRTPLSWIAPKRRIPSVTGRGDLQDLADRLDPERIPMRINQLPQDLNRRSSSV